jgi:hypothetical protein
VRSCLLGHERCQLLGKLVEVDLCPADQAIDIYEIHGGSPRTGGSVWHFRGLVKTLPNLGVFGERKRNPYLRGGLALYRITSIEGRRQRAR